jgi:hypothetical protein
MAIDFADPQIVGAVMSAASGILGAVLGAGVAYWAARNQYNTEYTYKKWDVLRAVLIELCHNQASLFLDLDRSLPAWLARCHRRGGLTELQIYEFIEQTRHYQTVVYDALFAELITTKFGSELAAYYRRLAWVNDWSRKVRASEVERDFDSYILNLSNAILLADDLIPVIAKECRNSPVKKWGRNLDVEEFEASRAVYRFGAELAKYDLQTIEEFLKTGKVSGAFSELLEKSERARFVPYVNAAKKISAWG